MEDQRGQRRALQHRWSRQLNDGYKCRGRPPPAERVEWVRSGYTVTQLHDAQATMRVRAGGLLTDIRFEHRDDAEGEDGVGEVQSPPWVA